MDYCSVEEMVALQYDSFAALNEWAKVVVLKMGHSKMVAE